MKIYLLLYLTVISVYASSQTFPERFSRTVAVSNISSPTAFVFVPDGRIFIAEQTGALRVVKNGSLLATPFLQLTVDSNGERGLLGVAIDPSFATNRFVYVYYTVPGSPAHNRISRFTANGDVAASGSEVAILELDNLSTATNHNGGAISFGADGKLYVAVGENANRVNAQNLDNYLGKILRINSDGSVPSGNPFTGSEAKKRIWAYGLRNPFTFCFQPVTNRLFVNDVGEGSKEEINDATAAGLNFGWPMAEGNSNDPSLTNPEYAYDHGAGDGKGCAITGGTFFNPISTTYPPMYRGVYFYQDLCNNWINYITVSGTIDRFPFATSVGGSSLALSTGPDGNLYYLSRTDRSLYKIVYDNSGAPSITVQPVNVTVSQNQPASFSVTATGNPAVTYQWKKNNVDIPGATASALSIASAQLSDNGTYKVIVSNISGSVTSNEVTMTVNAVVAVEEDSKNLIVYPTPAKHWLYVQCEKEMIEGVELRDNLGRVKITPLPERISQDLVAIDVRSLSAGVYFLMVQYPGGASTKKLVIGSTD